MAKTLTGKYALICGDDRSIVVTFPYDITGHTVYFTVRDTSTLTDTTDTTALIQKDVSSHTSPTAGVTTIALTHTDTRIAPGTYVYDIQDKDASGNISSVPRANIEFTEDVTKRTT